MDRSWRLLWCMVLVTAVSACHHVASYAVPTTARQAAYAGPVAIYAANRPPVGAKELGIVEVAGGGDERDIRVLFPALIRRVQRLGGNAVAIEKMGATYETIPTWSYGHATTFRCGWGPCSRWDSYPTYFETMAVVLRGRALWLAPPAGRPGEP